MNPTQLSDSGTAYRVWGSGRETIVIDTALGTCSAEWWHIAEKLSEQFRVVTYDRPGCGRSELTARERIVQNIVEEDRIQAVQAKNVILTITSNKKLVKDKKTPDKPDKYAVQ